MNQGEPLIPEVLKAEPRPELSVAKWLEQTRAGLIVRESLAGAWRTLGASQCALAATPAGAARKAALLQEARTFLGQSRAFKQELVDRKIDAVDASAAIEEIDHELQRCSEVFGGKLVR